MPSVKVVRKIHAKSAKKPVSKPVKKALPKGTLKKAKPKSVPDSLGEVPVEMLRARLSEMLGRVEFGRERISISKHGRPIAAVVSMDDLRRIEAAEDVRDVREADRALARLQSGEDEPILWAEAKKRLGL